MSGMDKEIAERIMDAVQNSAEYIAGEIPPFMQEIVRYGLFYHAVFAVLGILGLICVWRIKVSFLKGAKPQDEWVIDDKITVYVVMALLGFIPMVFVIYNTIVCAEALLAPKLYLLHTLKLIR